MARERIHLVYDGRCGLCVRSVGIVRRLDLSGVLEFHDASNRAAILARFPSLRGADFDTAMYAVTAGHEVFAGFFAFRRIAWVSPLTWILLPLFYAPGSSRLGPRLYAWVARNRFRLGCRSRACDLPPAAPEQRSKRE